MLAAVLGWVLPCQSTPSLLHKRPKGRFGLHAIVSDQLNPPQNICYYMYGSCTLLEFLGTWPICSYPHPTFITGLKSSCTMAWHSIRSRDQMRDYQMLNLGMCQCAFSKATISSFRALRNLGYETRSDKGGDRLQRSMYSS